VKFRTRKRDEVTLDMTPLIDAVFLLLIFFAVATTFTRETRLGIDLPEASGQPPVSVKESVEVSVSASGEYAVNGQPLVSSDRAVLRSAIEAAVAGNKDRPFFLTADAKAMHQSVITVMDIAGELGVVNVSIVTREPGR
jgi:biopolymer transport protein ExbD